MSDNMKAAGFSALDSY